MTSIRPAELYRREAARLRAMADIPTFRDVRTAYLEMAQRYDVLARQADTMAVNPGAPFAAPRPERNGLD